MIAGLGALEALASAPAGTVIAAFGRATYVRFPAGVVALTAPSVAPGPIHATYTAPLTAGKGAQFAVPASWLADLRPWRGKLPPPDHVAIELLAGVARHSALLHELYARRWQEASEAPDLATAARCLGGLGPGLTPSGDDALAGLLLAARLRYPDAEPDLVALAGTVDTHEISRAFLRWAAKGQSLESLHRLLGGDAAAAADLAATGHTSGSDLALGVVAGLTRPGP